MAGALFASVQNFVNGSPKTTGTDRRHSKGFEGEEFSGGHPNSRDITKARHNSLIPASRRKKTGRGLRQIECGD